MRQSAVQTFMEDPLTAGDRRRRHEAIVKKFEEFSEKHPDRPICDSEICAAIGVGERTLRASCKSAPEGTRQACRIRKAYAVCAPPPYDPDTGRLAGNCQLLYGGPIDSERRKVRYARFDRSSPYVAVWYSVADHKRRDRAIRDSAGQ